MAAPDRCCWKRESSVARDRGFYRNAETVWFLHHHSEEFTAHSFPIDGQRTREARPFGLRRDCGGTEKAAHRTRGDVCRSHVPREVNI